MAAVPLLHFISRRRFAILYQKLKPDPTTMVQGWESDVYYKDAN